MDKYLEKGTNYSYTIEHIKDITFAKLRSVAIDFTRRLPDDLSCELYDAIKRGVCQLQNEPELNMYLHALGLMHEAKLQYAFEHLPYKFTEKQSIDIIDYGCGQGIGAICYADFLSRRGKAQKVRRIILIEPSEMALKRAALHASCFFPSTEIVTILKGFDDLVLDDISTIIDGKMPTLHIFSNVLDLADEYFNLKSFAYLIKDRLDGWIGENQFICIEPYFEYDSKDELPHRFFEMLGIEPYYNKSFTRGTFVEKRDWTCQIVMGCKDASPEHIFNTPLICDSLSERSKLMDLALIAENEERYNKAFEYFSLAVEKYGWISDTALCKRKIGEYYYYGYGVNINYEEAVKWLLDAAKLGDLCAKNILGICYYHGKGVTQDFIEAVKWYRKAASLDYAESQYYLGLCYEEGYGVKVIPTEAVKWYCKAAEQGYAKAQYNLGVCYENGTGVFKDEAEAVKWYRKAAEQENASAQYCLGRCYHRGIGVEQDDDEAIKWIQKGVDQGLAEAQFGLGLSYAKGFGVSKDETEAVKWYLKAAEQGESRAQTNLGYCYDKGIGVPKDEAEAVKWFSKAAEQGEVVAQNNLGVCYRDGKGVTKDLVEAVKWFREAAEHGYARAQYNIGVCYYKGIGVPKDKAEAVKWYHMAAEQGYVPAQDALNNH